MPNDLISRDALLSKVKTAAIPEGSDYVTEHDVLFALAVDAVEVVRCKDCKHNGTWQCHMEYDEYYPEADIHRDMHGDDDFCSYGVKEDGESNDE